MTFKTCVNHTSWDSLPLLYSGEVEACVQMMGGLRTWGKGGRKRTAGKEATLGQGKEREFFVGQVDCSRGNVY